LAVWKKTAKEMRHLLGGLEEQPRKCVISLAAYIPHPRKHFILTVHKHSQGNVIFLGGFVSALKEILGSQGILVFW